MPTEFGQRVLDTVNAPSDPVRYGNVEGLENIVAAQRAGTLEEQAGPMAEDELTPEQAQKLQTILLNYKDRIDPEEYDRQVRRLVEYNRANPGVLKTVTPPDEEVVDAAEVEAAEEVQDPRQQVKDAASGGGGLAITSPVDLVVGAADIGKTLATGALGEVVGGWRGLLTLATGGSLDDSVDLINSTADAITLEPTSQVGKKVLETAAPALTFIDSAAKDLSSVLGMGNPEASTAIYTAIMGAPEIFGVKLRVRARKGGVDYRKAEQNIKSVANRLGINIKQSDLGRSIVEAARKMTPDERAAHAGGLRNALIQIRKEHNADLEVKEEKARNLHASIKANDISAFGKELDGMLRANGHDIERMPAVQKILSEIQGVTRKSPLYGKRTDMAETLERAEGAGLILPPEVRIDAKKAAKKEAEDVALDLQEIQTIRNRIDNARKVDKGATKLPPNLEKLNLSHQDRALDFIKNSLDRYLDYRADNAMLKGIDAWDQAESARRAYNKRWHADITMRNMLDLDATPAEISKWIRGKSLMGPKDDAPRLIRRMKELLGPNHPSIVSLRDDLLFDLVAPLLEVPPKYGNFSNTYTQFIRKNPDLMRELNIDSQQMRVLQEFSRIQANLPPKNALAARRFISDALARFGWGHGIAKAGMKVSIVGRIIRKLVGVDVVKAKEMLAIATGTLHGKPIMPKNTMAAGLIYGGAAYAEMQRAAGREVEDLE